MVLDQLVLDQKGLDLSGYTYEEYNLIPLNYSRLIVLERYFKYVVRIRLLRINLTKKKCRPHQEKSNFHEIFFLKIKNKIPPPAPKFLNFRMKNERFFWFGLIITLANRNDRIHEIIIIV